MTKDEAIKANQVMLMRVRLYLLHKLKYFGQQINAYILENIPDPEGHEYSVRDSGLVTAPMGNIIIRQNEEQAWKDAIASWQPGFVGLKIHVINISMTGFSLELSREYVRLGGIVVCATGNKKTSEMSDWDHVIDIGRVYETDLRKASESASSATLDLVAFNPMIKGEGDNYYFQQNGTSFASPFVMGLIMCLLSYWNAIGYTDNMRNYLIRHALDIGDLGKDNQTGYGLVQVDLIDYVDFPVRKNEYQLKELSPVGIDLGTQPFKVAGGIRNLVPIRHLLDAQNAWMKRTGKKISNLCPTWIPPTNGDKGIVRVFID